MYNQIVYQIYAPVSSYLNSITVSSLNHQRIGTKLYQCGVYLRVQRSIIKSRCEVAIWHDISLYGATWTSVANIAVSQSKTSNIDVYKS